MKKIDFLVTLYKKIRSSGINRITRYLILGGLGLIGTPLWEMIAEKVVQRELDIILPNKYEPIIGIGLIILALFYHYLFHQKVIAPSSIKDLKTEIKNIKQELSENYNKISKPIGWNYKLNSIAFDIECEFLPEMDFEFRKSKSYNHLISAINSNSIETNRCSTGIGSLELPKPLSEILLNKVNSIHIHIVENIENDLINIKKLMSLGFKLGKIDTLNISFCKELIPAKEFYKINLSSNDTYTLNITKHTDLSSKNDICSKLVLIETIINNAIPRTMPYQMAFSRFSLKDEHQNDFRFIPINNISILDSSILYASKNLKTVYTLGILKCMT